VLNNFSSTASDDDCRLAKGVVMVVIVPHSGVSVVVGVRVLIGLDSDKLVRTNETQRSHYTVSPNTSTLLNNSVNNQPM